MSPSFMTYSLPSLRTRPLALAAAMVPQAFMIVEGDDLGTDEAALKVGVDLTGSLRVPWCLS